MPKSHLRIESYGTIDELNSYIGLSNDHIADGSTNILLKEIQDRLFTIGSSLACDPDNDPLMKIPDLKEEDIQYLEQQIDSMDEVLPEMLPARKVTVERSPGINHEPTMALAVLTTRENVKEPSPATV